LVTTVSSSTNNLGKSARSALEGDVKKVRWLARLADSGRCYYFLEEYFEN